MAAPVCVAIIAEEGGDKESTLSELYGGKGGEGAGATPLYEAIGDVRSFSAESTQLPTDASNFDLEGQLDERLWITAKISAHACHISEMTNCPGLSITEALIAIGVPTLQRSMLCTCKDFAIVDPTSRS